MDYPPEIAMFTVTGHLWWGNPDTDDAGIGPNLEPIRGASILLEVDAETPIFNAPVSEGWIYQRPVPAATDYNGQITGVFDSTPDVMLPYYPGVTWKMTVSVPDFPDRVLHFTGSPGGEVKFGSFEPVPMDPGTDIIAWEAVVSEVTAARDDAVAAAVAAAASNPGVANGTAQLDGTTKLKSTQVPTRLTSTGLASSIGDLATDEGAAVAAAISRSVGLDVKAYGAKGDGTTDDTTAINAALTAAGTGGRVVLSKGVYKVTGTLTVPTWCTIEGQGYEPGAGGTSPTELKFTTVSGAAVGISLGNLATLRNLLIRGPGTMVGTTIGIDGATMYLDRVSVIQWATGVRSTGGYYTSFHDVEFSRNKVGLLLSACYNVSMYRPRFYCGSSVDDAPQTAISGGARGLSIFGGSIEGYASAVQMTDNSELGLYGVYFETGVNANAGGVWADGRDNISITAIGCFVYLNGHTRWITTSGSTDTALFARGNHFVAVSGSVQVPTAYIIAANQAVDIGSDNWAEVAKAGAAYVSASGGLPAAGTIVSMPAGISTGLAVYDGRRAQNATNVIALASAGAVTFDVSKGDQIVNLAANATSSTITNPSTIRETVSITWVQDATGGRTYSWPSVCKFAGNSAPSDTTLNTMTTVTFRYSPTAGRWNEISRAVAVPVS